MIFSYSSDRKSDVMKAFGLEASEGRVIEKNTGNIAHDNLGNPLTIKRFGGVRKGSIELINKDIASLIKLRKKLRG